MSNNLINTQNIINHIYTQIPCDRSSESIMGREVRYHINEEFRYLGNSKKEYEAAFYAVENFSIKTPDYNISLGTNLDDYEFHRDKTKGNYIEVQINFIKDDISGSLIKITDDLVKNLKIAINFARDIQNKYQTNTFEMFTQPSDDNNTTNGIINDIYDIRDQAIARIKEKGYYFNDKEGGVIVSPEGQEIEDEHLLLKDIQSDVFLIQEIYGRSKYQELKHLPKNFDEGTISLEYHNHIKQELIEELNSSILKKGYNISFSPDFHSVQITSGEMKDLAPYSLDSGKLPVEIGQEILSIRDLEYTSCLLNRRLNKDIKVESAKYIGEPAFSNEKPRDLETISAEIIETRLKLQSLETLKDREVRLTNELIELNKKNESSSFELFEVGSDQRYELTETIEKKEEELDITKYLLGESYIYGPTEHDPLNIRLGELQTEKEGAMLAQIDNIQSQAIERIKNHGYEVEPMEHHHCEVRNKEGEIINDSNYRPSEVDNDICILNEIRNYKYEDRPSSELLTQMYKRVSGHHYKELEAKGIQLDFMGTGEKWDFIRVRTNDNFKDYIIGQDELPANLTKDIMAVRDFQMKICKLIEANKNISSSIKTEPKPVDKTTVKKNSEEFKVIFPLFGKSKLQLITHLEKLQAGEKTDVIKGLVKDGKHFNAKLKLVPGKNDGEVNVEVYIDKKQEKNKGIKL